MICTPRRDAFLLGTHHGVASILFLDSRSAQFLTRLLSRIAGGIVRCMPLSRTQQPAADLFWVAGVGAGERASEPSIATERSSESAMFDSIEITKDAL